MPKPVVCQLTLLLRGSWVKRLRGRWELSLKAICLTALPRMSGRNANTRPKTLGAVNLGLLDLQFLHLGKVLPPLGTLKIVGGGSTTSPTVFSQIVATPEGPMITEPMLIVQDLYIRWDCTDATIQTTQVELVSTQTNTDPIQWPLTQQDSGYNAPPVFFHWSCELSCYHQWWYVGWYPCRSYYES